MTREDTLLGVVTCCAALGLGGFVWKSWAKKNWQQRSLKDYNEHINKTLPPKISKIDVVIRNGNVYQGRGEPALVGFDVTIIGNKIYSIAPHPLNLDGFEIGKEIDATNCWVMPGLVDIHSHYDLEIEKFPALQESIRHGVTSVLMGNCSISSTLGSEEELVSLFARVENMPVPVIQSWLKDRVTWDSPESYYEHVEELALGCNVASFIGHSAIRIKVMGLERSLTVHHPTKEEMNQMQDLLDRAMKAGFVGLSIDLLPWHRMTGTFTGISVPSQQATFSEYRKLGSVVRKANGVLQATPHPMDKLSIVKLFWQSTALLDSVPLRTSMLAAMDVVSKPGLFKLAAEGPMTFNRNLFADIRMQTLSVPFEIFSDGVVTPVGEETSCGSKLLDQTSSEARQQLLRDPTFVETFRNELNARVGFLHHKFSEWFIVSVPENADWVGKSVEEIAKSRGENSFEFFIWAVATYGDGFRWKTVLANHIPENKRWLLAHPASMPGFNDSGAHSRNMAFYDGGLHLLREALLHPDWMSIERAVQRLTSEPAEWFGIDAGVLDVGRYADVTIVDPVHLKDLQHNPVFENDPFLGVERMVNRNDPRIVKSVIVSGQVVLEDDRFHSDLGSTKFGRLLRRCRGRSFE
jgi:N-acyl-D-aspartate/D-glutamate deacylase